MNVDTYTVSYAVFHGYELLWWGGTCGILLIIILLLLRNRRMKKDLQQLRSLNTELGKDLQQQAAALSRSEQAKALFQQVVEELPAAVFITDPTGCIQYSSKAARKNSGYAEEELLAQPISMLLPQITTEQQAPPPFHETTQTQKKDGSSSPATVTVTDLRDPQGEVLGILFFLKDLRTIQQAEKKRSIEQQQVTERLRKSRRFETIGMMAGEVAHDLNNILSGVLHYPEQLLRTLPEDSPLRSPLLSLRHSGQQAVALVADLLNAAKAGSAIKEITDLNRLVEEILNNKECQDLFAKRPGISLRVRLCPNPIPVSCSPPHIRQCLYNLLLNGCDTINAEDRVGTITVSVENSYFRTPTPSPVSSDGPSGEYAILSVTDTGPCMSSADRARIFEPFYSKKFLKRSGTGIALAMLRNIMEEHNGWVDLSAENEPHRSSEQSNQSNRFDLYFPIRPVQNMYSAKESSKEELSGPRKGRGCGRGQQQQILIIEKDKEQQERASEFLTEIGYKALSVTDGTGAVSYLNRNRVDLVILDLVIIDLAEGELAEGVSIYEQILFLYPSQKTVLICTNSACKSVKEIQQRGKVLLLQAPFTEEQLQQAVKEGLS